MRAQQQALALRLGLLSGDEQRVLRIARRMVRRKIQRLEVVVVRFDDRALGDGIAELLEDSNNFMRGPDDGMLGADGAADAGEGDVDALRSLYGASRCVNARIESFRASLIQYR